MIANLLEGMEHEEAARLAGVSRSAAYEWHNRYEEEGIEGDIAAALACGGAPGWVVRWDDDTCSDTRKPRQLDFHDLTQDRTKSTVPMSSKSSVT
jgi:hypothetical protein